MHYDWAKLFCVVLVPTFREALNELNTLFGITLVLAIFVKDLKKN